MGNFKLNLDRPKISSEQINARQNFDEVLTQFKAGQPPIYKNPWFWGSAGLASVGLATMISLNALSNQTNQHDDTRTLNVTNLPEDTPCIKAPVKNEDIPYTTFVVDPKKGDQLELPSGTSVSIPENSLQAADPDAKVEIQIREFRDKASAFMAGIPMDYQNQAFESAGMIEIRGVQNGQEVKINPEKPIEVALNTTKDPENFEFWKLNETTGKWNSYPAEKINHAGIPDRKPVEQTQITQLRQDIKKDEQVIAQTSKQISLLSKPEATTFKIPTKGHQKFDLDFDKKEYPELAAFEKLVFEVVPTEGYDKNFTKKSWQNARLDKDKDLYFMQFSSDREKFRIEVRPILEGSELKTAQSQFDQAINSYQETKIRLEQEKKAAEISKQEHEQELKKMLSNQVSDAGYQAKGMPITLPGDESETELATRPDRTAFNKETASMEMASADLKFQTSRWGVFNCDNPIAYPKPFESEPALTWKEGGEARFDALYVFNLDKDNRYTYTFVNKSEFGAHKNDQLVILGITSDGQIGYLETVFKKNQEDPSKLVFARKSKEDGATLDWLKKVLHEKKANPA